MKFSIKKAFVKFYEFEAKLKKLNLTKKEFAKFVEIDYTTVIKWKSNNVPKYAEIILEYLIKQQTACEELKRLKDN